MLSGLLHPSSGEARVMGYVPWERQNAFKRQFALLMGQKNALWWDLPARESLELNRAIYEVDPRHFRTLVGELSELLEVADKLNVMVRELSLGERMKMELIAALLHSPRVLFLDEPTIGLDAASQKKVRDFLRLYNAEHRIVTMLTSHYMRDIEELCARVILIDHGRIFFDGPLNAIVDRFATHKILALSWEPPGPSRLEALGEILEQTPQSVRLKVPRPRITEVCREILTTTQIRDITVEDLPLEEAIGKLLQERRDAHPGQPPGVCG
jgi:ABC-2 type transport system ATP-binding protein